MENTYQVSLYLLIILSFYRIIYRWKLKNLIVINIYLIMNKIIKKITNFIVNNKLKIIFQQKNKEKYYQIKLKNNLIYSTYSSYSQ